MKKIRVALFLLVFINSVFAQEKDTSFIDKRDNKIYKIVKIGNQVWMAENLAFNCGSGCWAYDNDQSNVTKYGYLYNWETAKNSCPVSWHLPSEEEFDTLLRFSGGSDEETYRFLIPDGSSGFSICFGGYRNEGGEFDGSGNYAEFWTSSSDGSESAYGLCISISNSKAAMMVSNISWGLSVRCIKDN